MAPRELQLPEARTTEIFGGTAGIERSLAHPTRTIRVDHLCEKLSELPGIVYRALDSAFAGEKQNVAIDAIKMAVAENLTGTPQDWQRYVLA